MKFTKEQLITRARESIAELNLIAISVTGHEAVTVALQTQVEEIALAALTAPQPEPEHIANALIAAIEKEQERLHGEDYLMDSKDCIDVIREEIQRPNACRTATLPVVQGDDHATD